VGNKPLRYATSVLKSLRGGAVLQDFPQVSRERGGKIHLKWGIQPKKMLEIATKTSGLNIFV